MTGVQTCALPILREVGHERAIVYENGPHVTHSEPMLLPLVKGGSIGTLGALFGMWLYDLLAGVKKKERRRIIHKISVMAMEPSIREEVLVSGAYYYEYRTDDSRLTIEIIKEAVDRNAHALNYCKVTGFLYSGSKISGVKVTDLLTGFSFEVKSKMVVNATGPWVDYNDSLDSTSRKDKLLLSKGVHIVVDGSRLPIGQAMYFDAGGGRMIFAIPREGKVYIGTTETEYHKDQDISNPIIEKSDRDYLLASVNAVFEGINLIPADVESGWAGLRPLIKQEGKKPGEISRKDETFVYKSGLISIAGGKLTGYRKMAERIVSMVSDTLKKDHNLLFSKCVTDITPISGGNVGGGDNFDAYIKTKVEQVKIEGWNEADIKRIVSRYGSNCDKLFSIAKEINTNEYAISTSKLVELEYSIRFEMIVTPLDFFVRRTGDAYFNIKLVIEESEAIFKYMKNRLNWTTVMAEKIKFDMDKELKYLRSLKD